MNKKLLILGDARHGKDTVAELIRQQTSMTFKSSSEFANERVVFPAIGQFYNTLQECFYDRVNWRTLWYELISRYNHEDPSLLAWELLQEADIYVGMRSKRELETCKEKGLFDHIIWVDASARLPPESKDSNQLTMLDADYVVHNHDTQKELSTAVKNLVLDLGLMS